MQKIQDNPTTRPIKYPMTFVIGYFIYKDYFELIKKELAATGDRATYMLKYDGDKFFIQREAIGTCGKFNLPMEICDEIRISDETSNKIVQFPAKQLYRLAECLHVL